jgi:hypothetical protein
MRLVVSAAGQLAKLVGKLLLNGHLSPDLVFLYSHMVHNSRNKLNSVNSASACFKAVAGVNHTDSFLPTGTSIVGGQRAKVVCPVLGVRTRVIRQ